MILILFFFFQMYGNTFSFWAAEAQMSFIVVRQLCQWQMTWRNLSWVHAWSSPLHLVTGPRHFIWSLLPVVGWLAETSQRDTWPAPHLQAMLSSNFWPWCTAALHDTYIEGPQCGFSLLGSTCKKAEAFINQFLNCQADNVITLRTV